MDKITRIKYALVAISEARLTARKATGSASNANPTPLQAERIALADMDGGGFEEAKSALESFESQPHSILLYGSDGGGSAADLLEEIRTTLYA